MTGELKESIIHVLGHGSAQISFVSKQDVDIRSVPASTVAKRYRREDCAF